MLHFEPTQIRNAVVALLGDPNARLSTSSKIRYGSHGSLAIDLHKAAWYDHEHSVGGGILDLIENKAALCSRVEQIEFLRKHDAIEGVPPIPLPSRQVESYSYRDDTGAVLFEVVRYEPKKFLQRRPDGKGGWFWNVKGAEQVPYQLPELLASGDAVVHVAEGEKDCDRLGSLGLIATCNAGGAGKWRDSHAQRLQGRRVVVLPDNDDAGRAHAQQVATSLHGIAAEVRIVELPGLPPKGDVSDWLNSGGTADELQRLICATLPVDAGLPRATKMHATGEQERKHSQAHSLIAFARGRFDFLHDANGDVYAKDKVTGEVRRLGGRPFKDKLLAGFYETTGDAAREQSLNEALSTLRAYGRFTGEPQSVNVRVACVAGSYYLDLCEPGNSRAIEIDAKGWRVVENAPVLFVRGDAMRPVPEPTAAGDLGALWNIANVPKNQRMVVAAWLIDCLRPDTPYPGLDLNGEQGSGKSTTAEALRKLIDPNACNLRGSPKTVEDIFVTAGQNHVVAYENVSHLARPMQDALAILSTGGGYAKRQLYTDAEEHVINVRRPWIVNGIGISVTQQDLVDRTISIECPRIESRQSSSKQWSAFEAKRAAILGGVLDVFSKALAVLPGIRIPGDEQPRLMEFAMLGIAVEKAMDAQSGIFMAQFNAMRAETVARTIDASPVAVAVLALLAKRPHGICAPLGEILATLDPEFHLAGADVRPRTAKGLGDELRRAAPALRQIGVECVSLGKGSGGVIRWKIKIKQA